MSKKRANKHKQAQNLLSAQTQTVNRQRLCVLSSLSLSFLPRPKNRRQRKQHAIKTFFLQQKKKIEREGKEAASSSQSIGDNKGEYNRERE